MPRVFGKTVEPEVTPDPTLSQEDTVTITAETPATDAPATDASATPETPEVLNGVTSEDKAKRGRPKLSELPPVALDDLGDEEDVPEDEWSTASLADGARIALPRSDAQVKIDNAVAKVHAAWVEAGKPALNVAPRKRYTVKPEVEAATRGMLTRAGVLHKVRVIQNTLHNGQGMAVITFTAIDRPIKEKVSEVESNLTDEEKLAVTRG